MMRVTLTTTGRRTRQPREVTLYAFGDGGRLVIVGSLGGAPKDPAWVGNLRANPQAPSSEAVMSIRSERKR